MTPYCGRVVNQLFNELNISGIFLLLLSPNARKMTKFGLNDMFENMKLFLKRASSNDQIKSSMFFSLQFYIEVVEVLHYVSQKSISFLLSFAKKVENALTFLHIWLTSRKKAQNNLQNSSLAQGSFVIVHK